MKKFCFTFKKLIPVFLILLLLAEPLFACSKKKKAKKNSSTTNTTETVVDTTSGPIKLPSTEKNKAFFYKLDPEVLAGVEKGSPSSIKAAMHKLHKSSEEYADNEKVLLAVAAAIYEIVWPSENINWNVYPIEVENNYTAAIKSVKAGIFDTSTGNVDFLTSILPALVLVKFPENKNFYEDCYTAVKKALEYREDSVLANYLLGKYYYLSGDYENSVLYLGKAYSEAKDSFEIGMLYSDVLVKSDNRDKAEVVLKSFSEKNPDNLQVLKQNAYISFSHGDLVAAEEYVARVLQQTPNDLEFVLFRARIFVEKKDYIHAVSLLDMYARQNNTNLDYLILRARVQLDWSKNYTLATETVEKAIELYPEDAEVLMLAARISSTTDSPVAGKYADELAEQVLNKYPDNESALIYALDGLLQRENWKEAYEVSTKLMQKENPSSEIILRHVKACVKSGKTAEAMDVASKNYSKDKTDENIISAYVYAYVNYSSRDASLTLINSLMTSSSQKMRSFLYFHRSYLQRSEEQILADLRSSLIANPRNDEALFRLYEIYYSKKDYRKAQYYLRQVVAIKPNDSSIKALNENLTKLIK